MNQHTAAAGGSWYTTPQSYNYCPYCGHSLVPQVTYYSGSIPEYPQVLGNIAGCDANK